MEDGTLVRKKAELDCLESYSDGESVDMIAVIDTENLEPCLLN